MRDIISYYNQFDEWGRLEREPIEFQVNWHYISKYLPPTGNVLDNGAGPGKYAMKLALDGYKVTLTDLTPKLIEIAKEKAEEFNLKSHFTDFLVADARDLTKIQDEQFDASLMLGPMYHIQEQADRIKAIQELHRVTKKGGLVFVAFMPRVKHLLTSLANPENWKPNDQIDIISRFNQTGCFDHQEVGRFTGAYYYNIDEIKPFMESNGFRSLELIGSNVAATLNKESWDYWKEKGEQEYEKLVNLLIEKADDPYMLGVSSHLLYIGTKK